MVSGPSGAPGARIVRAGLLLAISQIARDHRVGNRRSEEGAPDGVPAASSWDQRRPQRCAEPGSPTQHLRWGGSNSSNSDDAAKISTTS